MTSNDSQIDPEILERVDKVVEGLGWSREQFVTLAIESALDVLSATRRPLLMKVIRNEAREGGGYGKKY